MKIRTGFVSNSSSSSFVVLGFPVPCPRDYDEAYALTEEIEKLDVGTFMDFENDTIYVGKTLMTWDGEGDCSTVDAFSVEEYIGKINSNEKLAEYMKRKGFQMGEMKIYGGTIAC